MEVTTIGIDLAKSVFAVSDEKPLPLAEMMEGMLILIAGNWVSGDFPTPPVPNFREQAASAKASRHVRSNAGFYELLG